jgi:hypothetical protein
MREKVAAALRRCSDVLLVSSFAMLLWTFRAHVAIGAGDLPHAVDPRIAIDRMFHATLAISGLACLAGAANWAVKGGRGRSRP